MKAKSKKSSPKFSPTNPRLIMEWMTYVLAGVVLGLLILFLVFGALTHNVIYPGVWVADQDVSQLSQEKALEQLQSASQEYLKEQFPVKLSWGDRQWQLEKEAVRIHLDETVAAAHAIGRDQQLIKNFQTRLQTVKQPTLLPLKVQLNQAYLEPIVASMAASLYQEAIPASLAYNQATNTFEVIQGNNGYYLDEAQLTQSLVQSVALLKPVDTALPIVEIDQSVSPAKQQLAIARAESLLGKQLILSISEDLSESWELQGEELYSFVDFEDGYSYSKIQKYLEEVALAVNREPVNAKFRFDDQANKVTEFAPPKTGRSLNVRSNTQLLKSNLELLETEAENHTIQLDIAETQPQITLANANDLGITELLGRGESEYKGSIPSRVHNVALAASRITGTLVAPGEEFSFVTSVGDISRETGFQSAYVIRNGRTEPGDGGGVCQDSTTVFRAALDAGFTITEWHPHSYRVGYYEQNMDAGMDATIYSPSVDLKFLNDTEHHILIQATPDTPNRKLVVDIYGTSDGRTSEITNHQVWGITPPPPDVYIDDPTLAPGQIKQVDWKAWGAKAKFDYKVVSATGEVLVEKTFYSNFKPWSAKFLRGPQI